jgi:hypothetical protein
MSIKYYTLKKKVKAAPQNLAMQPTETYIDYISNEQHDTPWEIEAKTIQTSPCEGQEGANGCYPVSLSGEAI